MSEDEGQSDSQLQPQNDPQTNPPQERAPDILDTNQQQLDLSSLPEEEKRELIKKHGEAKIETAQRQTEIGQDANALHARLQTMGSHAQEMAEAGQSTTITNTHEDRMGRTEIIVGSSEQAKRGRLSRAQRGHDLLTPTNVLILVGIIAVVVIVVAVALGNG
jgi:hypothetical protein